MKVTETQAVSRVLSGLCERAMIPIRLGVTRMPDVYPANARGVVLERQGIGSVLSFTTLPVWANERSAKACRTTAA